MGKAANILSKFNNDINEDNPMCFNDLIIGDTIYNSAKKASATVVAITADKVIVEFADGTNDEIIKTVRICTNDGPLNEEWVSDEQK